MNRIPGKKNKGFTLIELIIVIVVLAVLAGISIPNIGAYIEKTKTTNAIADANQLAAAMNIYNSTLSSHWTSVPDNAESILSGPDVRLLPKLKGEFGVVAGNIYYDNIGISASYLWLANDGSAGRLISKTGY